MAVGDDMAAKTAQLERSYFEHLPVVQKLQSRLMTEDLISSEQQDFLLDRQRLSDFQEDRITDYLSDTVSIFRFLRRAQYNVEKATDMILRNLKWRLDNRIDHLNVNEMDSTTTYLEEGLFHFIWPPGEDKTHFSNSHFASDKYGRPVALLRLCEVTRPDDGSLDPLKNFILAMMEISRRYLRDLSEEESKPKVQFVLIVDLKDAGINNMVGLSLRQNGITVLTRFPIRRWTWCHICSTCSRIIIRELVRPSMS